MHFSDNRGIVHNACYAIIRVRSLYIVDISTISTNSKHLTSNIVVQLHFWDISYYPNTQILYYRGKSSVFVDKYIAVNIHGLPWGIYYLKENLSYNIVNICHLLQLKWNVFIFHHWYLKLMLLNNMATNGILLVINFDNKSKIISGTSCQWGIILIWIA